MGKSILDAIQKLSELCEKYKDVAIETNNNVNELKKEITTFEVCVPFVGEFSVGKSALLNNWIGEKLLPEDQLPTTAMATELRWADSSQMHIITSDGSRHLIPFLPKNAEEANQLSMDSIPNINSQMHAVCTSNSAHLKDISLIIPVDMPGTDSGIKRHTEALYQYAHKGAAFFLVVSVEQGTIPATLLAFLEELQLENTPLFLVLNKCDLKTPDDIQAISDELVNRCLSIGYFPKQVLYTSRFNEDTPELIHNVLKSLDIDELCNMRYVPKALFLCERIKGVIQTLRDCSTVDTKQLYKQIKEHEHTIELFNSVLHKEENKLKRKLDTIPHIVASDVYNALLKNTNALISSVEVSQDALVTRITGIVNRVYSESLNRNLNTHFEKMLQDIEVILHEENSRGAISTEKISEGLLKIPSSLEQLGQAFASRIPEVSSDEAQKNNRMLNAYRVVSTALAITSSVLAPIVELVVVFLPDIIRLLSNPVEKRREQIRHQLECVVFQDVRNQVENNIQTEMPEIAQGMLSTIRTEWGGKIEENRTAITFIQQEIATKESALQDQHKDYDADIAIIDELSQTFTMLINTEPAHA